MVMTSMVEASIAESIMEALSVVSYELFVLTTLFGSWLAWRMLSHRGPHLQKKAKIVWDPTEERKRGGSESPVQDRSNKTREAQRMAAQIMAMSSEQYTVALRMYRDMCRMRLDSEIRDERFYFSLIQASIRVGNADVAGQLLKSMQKHDVPRTLPFFQSVLKLLAAKHFFKECLVVYDLFGSELPADKTVLSCIAFAATEMNETLVASKIFERMQSDSEIELSSKDYVNIFRVFAKKGDADGAVELLYRLKTSKIQLDTVLINIVLSVCSSNGMLDRARQIFDEAKEGAFEGVSMDAVSFNTIMKGYAQGSKIDKCFEVFKEMAARKVDPDDVTYGILLDACIADNDLNKANDVMDMLIQSGMEINTVLYTTFIKGFVRAQMLDRGMQLYEKMKQTGSQGEKAAKPDLITYSILIKAHSDNRKMDTALALLEDMRQAGYEPDDIVLNHLLEGCCHVSNVELGQKLFADLGKKVKTSLYTLSTMLKLYGKCGRSDDAVKLVATMEDRYGLKPTIVIYTCLMSGCVRNRKYDQAVEVFEQLKKAGVKPDKMTYSTIIDACRQGGKWEQAYDFCEAAFAAKVPPSGDFLNQLLGQTLQKAHLNLSRKLHNLLGQHGVPITNPAAARKLKYCKDETQ